MFNNIHEILFLIAQDFVRLTPLQQVNVGIRLEICGVDAAVLPTDEIGLVIFKAAYEKGKIPGLVKEMRQYLYE
jgi:hypothetical protein